MVSKKYYGILDKFTYNPFAIVEEEMQYFPNINNLHFYSLEESQKMKFNPHIKTFTHWYEINFRSYEKVQNTSQIYKKIYYSEQDRDYDYSVARHHFMNSKQNIVKNLLKFGEISG
jgi:hypothetical protein